MDWLSDFCKHSSYGESTPNMMYWTGVSTIAAVLRRKVWFDQCDYQWSPNFYILLVGAPGAVKKSTSIDMGMRLLKTIEDIKLGPAIITWQALIEYIAENKQEFAIRGSYELFETCCTTIALSEFGSFFDPEDRCLIDNLTDLWDGKIGKIEKVTKTAGNDSMINPWINIIAATTPKWLANNFGDGLVGGGLAGRFIYVYSDMPEVDVAYPKRQMPAKIHREKNKESLISGLKEMAEYSGDYELTEAAYKWGEYWYSEQRKKLRLHGIDSLEAGFSIRKQVHLHKLAMVISASKGKFPIIDVEELEEADKQLSLLDNDAKKIFGYVGQNKISRTAREIVEEVEKHDHVEKRALYRKVFFRTMSSSEFEDAVKSAIQADLIIEADSCSRTILISRKSARLD